METAIRPRHVPRVFVAIVTALTLAFAIIAVDTGVEAVHPPAAHAFTCDSGCSFATGISLHENIDWYGVIHYGFTFQPLLTSFIAAALNQNPPLSTAGAELVTAYACASAGAEFGPVVVAWVALCNAAIAYYGVALVNAFKAAAYYGGCVTIKAQIPIFSLQLSHIDQPYADFGSWCDLQIHPNPAPQYHVPPTDPNTGSPSVGCLPWPQCQGV